MRRLHCELGLVLIGFSVLAMGLTYPLAFHPGSLGYDVSNGDGQFSVWNVAWVARTLVVDPAHVFDANIFYPHRWTLAYSEANLGAGALALPVYWATRNAYTALNFALLASFVLSATGMYYLARYLVRDRRAAVIAAISFAYCPHVFAHLPHIQLLMTAGLPFSLLAFHRLVDRPSAGRAVVLGLAMAAQAYFCAYYAVFVTLMVGYAVFFTAFWRRLWRDTRYLMRVLTAAIIAVIAVLPLAIVYVMLQRSTGFSRPVEAAQSYSANWSAYLASSAYIHAWMLALLPAWNEVLFPGFVAVGFGVAGGIAGWLAWGRLRELAVLYGSMAALACWESFGPSAGLYRLTYVVMPGFSFMRAPSRFGLLVVFALGVLAALAISRLLERVSRPLLVAGALTAMAVAEALVPLKLMPVPTEAPMYRQLATLPPGPVIELPVYSDKFAFMRTRYMLSSTIHWMPLVDAYSDYIPKDFLDSAEVLGEFPTKEALARLERDHVRYAVFHLDRYGSALETLRGRLAEFAPYLRQLYQDDQIALYEITSYPSPTAGR